MKKILSLIMSLSILLLNVFPVSALGEYEGGIYRKTNNNAKSYQYEEVSFVTGTPAILKGTVTIKDVDKDKEESDLQKAIAKVEKDQQKLDARVNRADTNRRNARTNNENQEKSKIEMAPIPSPRIQQVINLKGRKINQSYELNGTDQWGNEVAISRNVSIEPSYEYYQGQKITTAKVTDYSETITTGDKSYTLNEDLSEITESVVSDRKPAIEYFAGNSAFYKVFETGEGEKMIIQMDSRSSGYDQHWGDTSTKVFNYTINTYGPSENIADQGQADPTIVRSSALTGVNGTYTVKVSKNTNKDFGYSENDPMRISFSGGYFITEQNHSALEYTYDVNAVQGRGNLEFQNNPSVKRLFAPVLTDMQGHWAEEPVKIITALGGFDPAKKIFLPSSFISREEFARAILYSSGLYDEDTKDNTLRQEIFSDVKRNDPNYKYIKKIVEREMMIGRDENKFEPKEPITRIEAIAILTNSLGLEKFIPNGAYSTGFDDEYLIPGWAFEAAYIAQAIGLVQKGGSLNPNEYLTKAEACEMLVGYTNYMINDLKEDYMYGTLNY